MPRRRPGRLQAAQRGPGRKHPTQALHRQAMGHHGEGSGMTTTVATVNGQFISSTTGPALLREISMREALGNVVSMVVISERGTEVISHPFGLLPGVNEGNPAQPGVAQGQPEITVGKHGHD